MGVGSVRLDGEWTVGAPSVDGDGEDQDPTVWRIEYVRSDDIAGQLPGKVYIRLRYLDSFNIDTGNRSRVIDTGSGYLTSTGGSHHLPKCCLGHSGFVAKYILVGPNVPGDGYPYSGECYLGGMVWPHRRRWAYPGRLLQARTRNH